MNTEKYFSVGPTNYEAFKNFSREEIYKYMYGSDETYEINANDTLCRRKTSYVLSFGIHMFKTTMNAGEHFTVNKNFVHWNHINHPNFLVSDHVSFIFSGSLRKDIEATLLSGEKRAATYNLGYWTELTFRAHEFYTEDVVDFTSTYTALEDNTSFYCIFRRDNLDFSAPPQYDLGPIYRKRIVVDESNVLTIPKGYIAFTNVPGFLEHDFIYSPHNDKTYTFQPGSEVLFVKLADDSEDI